MAQEIDWVGPRSLRLAIIPCFLISFPLAIPASVFLQRELPALGLVPLFGSTVFSLLLLRRTKKKHSPLFIFFSDAILAASLLVTYIFTWILCSMSWYRWRHDENALLMLAGYATMPVLISFGIHTYLAGRAIFLGIMSKRTPPTCPHCSHQIRPDVAWLPRTSDDIARLIAGDDGEEEARYRDEEQAEQYASSQPEVVRIIGQTAGSPKPSTSARTTLSDN